jgi:HemY protein
MRTLFAIALVALLLGVGFVALIEGDPGYVLLSYGNYTLETSLWVGLFLLGLSLWIFYQLLRLLYRIIGGQRSFRSWLGTRRSDKAHRSTNKGIISYTLGNWARARRQLLRGAQNGEAPLVNYLLAARASDRLEEPERVAEFLQSAADEEPDAELAIDIIRAENRLRTGEYESALKALEKPARNAAKHPYVLELQRRAYVGLGDEDKLLTLLPNLVKHTLLSEDEARSTERDIHTARIERAAEITGLHSTWESLPSSLKRDKIVLHLYVARQVELGDYEAAEVSILKAIKRQWDVPMVRQFGLLEGDNTAGRLTRAERWLPEHPEDAELLLCLGRLCLREKLWGKARDYFESSYRVNPGAEVCAELGRLLVGLGEPKVASAYYREGLAASTSNLPDLPMPDKIVSNHHLLERKNA